MIGGNERHDITSYYAMILRHDITTFTEIIAELSLKELRNLLRFEGKFKRSIGIRKRETLLKYEKKRENVLKYEKKPKTVG